MLGSIDFDATMDAWARFIRTGQAVLSAVEAELKRAGFPPLAWYDALLELRRAGQPGLRQFELGERMLLAQYNLSRLVGRLARAGHLTRQPCPEDGRGQVLRLTAGGAALLERMWPAYRAAVLGHFAGTLDAAEIEAVARLMAKLAPRGLRAAPQSRP